MTRHSTVVTHNGSFHADDVFAVATLRLILGKKIKIIRTRDSHFFSSADYVVDIGTVYDPKQNRFDHHQEGGAGKRKNGIPYASFGLVWKKFGAKLCGSKKAAEIVEKSLVESIDAVDSGVSLYTPMKETQPYVLQDLVHAFNNTWREKERNTDGVFFYLVEIAQNLLKREIITAQDTLKVGTILERCYIRSKDKRILIVDAPYPYEEIASKYKRILFMVRPDTQKKWRLEAIQERRFNYQARKLLPKQWAGKRDKELAKITGVSDATFCHNGRFMAVSNSKDGAVKLAHLALKD